MYEVDNGLYWAGGANALASLISLIASRKANRGLIRQTKEGQKKMRRNLMRCLRAILMVCVIALSATPTFGYDVDDFSYSYSLSTKEATLTGYSGSSSHVTIPTSFKVAETYKDDDGETHTRHHLITVTAVGKNAFADREFITSVSFHDRIKTIGVDAFRGCTALKSFKTPSSLQSLGAYALSGCTGLETAEINGNNLVVGSNLFVDCTGLRSVIYGSGVVKIGGGEEVAYSSCWAFRNCTNLTSIVVESTAVRCIPDYFCNMPSLTHLSFAGTITNIGTSALSGCTGLTTVDATLRPVSVGASALSGCTNLNTPIDFSDCTEIGSGAFWNCRSMTGTLSLPKLSIVPFEAFYGCSAITDLSLESVETIGNESFYNCKSLASVSFSDTLRTIGSSAFYNCRSLVSVSFPGSLRTIGSWAFEDCTSLQAVLLPDSLASIGSEAFSGCTGLETAHVDGNGSLRIGNSLFYNCTNLETVVIGAGVKSIEDGKVNHGWSSTYYYDMFSNCSRLKRVEIRTTKLPKLPSYMFRATPVEEVYIAGGCNEIGEEAFSQCTSLIEITGDFSTVTNIANNAFNGCSNLAKLPSFQNVEIMGSSAFYNCRAMTGVLSLPKLATVPSRAFYCCRGITGVELGAAVTIGSEAFAAAGRLLLCPFQIHSRQLARGLSGTVMPLRLFRYRTL